LAYGENRGWARLYFTPPLVLSTHSKRGQGGSFIVDGMENVNAGGTIYVQYWGFVRTNMNGFWFGRHMVWPLSGEFHCNCLGGLANSG
jgi:hypothetical protein